MSTATNGAATEAAFEAIVRATRDAGTSVAGTSVADATASIVPTAAQARGTTQEVGQAWLVASKTVTELSLDAYDASVRAYLDYAESVAAASRAAWAIELTQHNTKIVSEFVATYSNAARGLFTK